MTIRNRSRVSLNFLDQLHHGPVVVQVLFFLFRAHFCAAQRPPLSSAPPFFDSLPPQPKFNPSLALLMLIIVGAFFCLGFFSIYIRRCTERRYGGGRLGVNSAALGGGGRFSRRGQQGLDAAVIRTFPTFLYSMVKGHKIGKAALECAVCLNEFEDDDTLRLIPKCSHVFHPDCIDAWLASHNTCPVCRANLEPKPDDIPFDSNSLFEPDQLPENEAQNDIQIQVPNESDRDRGSEVAPNRPPRSWSTGWRLFPKSRSIGHIRPGESVERFTLRLPEEIRNQLLNSHLNRTKSCVAFPRVTSSRRGYRSRSGGRWRSKNYYYYEQFDQEQQQPSDQMLHQTKSGSVRLSNGEVNNGKQPKSFLKSVKSIKSPFDRFYGVDRNGSRKDTAETSLDKLRPDDDSELV